MRRSTLCMGEMKLFTLQGSQAMQAVRSSSALLWGRRRTLMDIAGCKRGNETDARGI
jgi:hypothetical protein